MEKYVKPVIKAKEIDTEGILAGTTTTGPVDPTNPGKEDDPNNPNEPNESKKTFSWSDE